MSNVFSDFMEKKIQQVTDSTHMKFKGKLKDVPYSDKVKAFFHEPKYETFGFEGMGMSRQGFGKYLLNNFGSNLRDWQKEQIRKEIGADGDPINHPKHYTAAGATLNAEPIDLCEQLDFCIGNAVKYVLRAPYKGNELEDLEKAHWYLNRWLNEKPVANIFFIHGALAKKAAQAFRKKHQFIKALIEENPNFGNDKDYRINRGSVLKACTVLNEMINRKDDENDQ